MALLKLIIITLTLLVEGGSSQERIDVFYHLEKDGTLSCKGPSSPGPQDCSRVSWLYNKDSSRTFSKVTNGKFVPKSGQDGRQSLNPDCSLVIRNIMPEDLGLYTCRQNGDSKSDVLVHLNILTIHPDPAESDQKKDSEVLLECTLFRYRGLTECRHNGLRWVNESGFELEEGVQKSSRGSDCLSHLTVKLQSGNSKKFRCLYVKGGRVEIEAEYTPGLKDPGPALTPAPKPDPEAGPDLTLIIVGVLVGVLLLLVVTSAILIKHRRRGAKVTVDVQTPTQPPDEPESDLTYITVSHIQHQEKKKKTEKEEQEDVTYSAVRPGVRTETYDDPSSLYSNISRPK